MVVEEIDPSICSGVTSFTEEHILNMGICAFMLIIYTGLFTKYIVLVGERPSDVRLCLGHCLITFLFSESLLYAFFLLIQTQHSQLK